METGTRPDVDETDVDASRESTNVDDGTLNSVTCTWGVTLDPLAVGKARKPNFTWDEHRTEKRRPTTKAISKLATAADLRDTQHFSDSPRTTATTTVTPPSEVVRLCCTLVNACGGATILGCVTSTPSLQSAQRQSEHRSSEGPSNFDGGHLQLALHILNSLRKLIHPFWIGCSCPRHTSVTCLCQFILNLIAHSHAFSLGSPSPSSSHLFFCSPHLPLYTHRNGYHDTNR